MIEPALSSRRAARAGGLLACALLAATLGAAARGQNPPGQNPPAQDPPQRPVFRVGTDVVRVDVYPRRDGRVVEGLTREDFEVFEDGERQAIDTFEYVEFDDWGPDVDALDPRDAREAMRMAADPRNRVFVFFLDTYHVTWQGALRAREPILRFLREGLGPRDLFGVLTARQSPELLTLGRVTSDAATAMTLERSWGLLDTPVIDPDEALLEGCAMGGARSVGGLLRLWRFDRTLSHLEELMVRLSAVRQERKNIVLVSDRWPNVMSINRAPAPLAAGPGQRPGPSRADGTPGPAPQRGRGSFPGTPGLFGANSICSAEAARLGGIDFRRRFDDLPDLARAANVALYVMVPGAQTLFNDPSGQFRGLAEDTDGLSIFTNDLAQGLERVVDHQTAYYMLGYRSTQAPSERRVRKIEVKTTRRGVDLELRREYYPPTTDDLAARDATVAARTDVERALDALERIRETTNLFVQVAPREGRVVVTAEVAAQAVARGGWRRGADVEAIARNPDGAEVGRAVGRIAERARGARLTIAIAPGETAARVAVRVSGASADLADFVEVRPATTPIFGVPEVSRAGSLPSMPFEPAAELQFQRTERVRLEWPVALALDEHAVRVVNAAGEDRPVDLAVVELGDDRRVLRADLRLLSLAPADYVLEVTGRAGETSDRRLLAFRVLR